MNFYHIMDHFEKTELAARMSEDTTMDAVAFLPAHLGTVKARAADLAKKKLDWHIEILENEDNREIWFEKEFHLVVPNEHWEIFCSIFDSVPCNNTHLNLKGLLNETIEEEMEDLRRELKVSFARMFDSAEFRRMDKIANTYKWRFPTKAYETRKKLSVAIRHENRKNDIQDMYRKLLEAYGEDRGNLELFISAVQSGEPLNSFDVLKGYDQLYGTRVISRYEDVRLVFESIVDMTGQLTQSISITDPELLSKIEEESTEVKVVKNVIYPNGGAFTSRFLRVLSDTIEDLGTEEVQDEEK